MNALRNLIELINNRFRNTKTADRVQYIGSLLASLFQ